MNKSRHAELLRTTKELMALTNVHNVAPTFANPLLTVPKAVSMVQSSVLDEQSQSLVHWVALVQRILH